MKALLLASAIVSAGCATQSGVIPAGSGSFNITKQAATGFSGLGNLKAETYQEAAQHCGKKDFEVVNYSETKGPYILGNYPRVDLQFTCK